MPDATTPDWVTGHSASMAGREQPDGLERQENDGGVDVRVGLFEGVTVSEPVALPEISPSVETRGIGLQVYGASIWRVGHEFGQGQGIGRPTLLGQ
jgi:hypothetical protein